MNYILHLLTILFNHIYLSISNSHFIIIFHIWVGAWIIEPRFTVKVHQKCYLTTRYTFKKLAHLRFRWQTKCIHVYVQHSLHSKHKVGQLSECITGGKVTLLMYLNCELWFFVQLNQRTILQNYILHLTINLLSLTLYLSIQIHYSSLASLRKE